MNVSSLLEHAAKTWPDRCALIDAETDRHYSFREFVGSVFECAHRLLETFDTRPGDRIALLGDATPGFLFADYGVMSAGRVKVSLDPSLATRELLAQIHDSGARVLLYCPAYAPHVDALLPDLQAGGIEARSIDTIVRDQPMARTTCPVQCQSDWIAALNYTGGTTGIPKAVVHTHGSYCAALLNIAEARRRWTGDRMLNVRPLWPIAAILLLAHLMQGGTLILGAHFEPGRFLELVERYRPTCTSLVPTHLIRILRRWEVQRSDVTSLACIEVGAAAMSPELFERAVAAFGPIFSVIYGLTEAPWSCYRPPSSAWELLADPVNTLGLVGATTTTTEIVVSDGLTHLPPGVTGEVLIRGPHVMQGYWNQPELTAAVLKDGWFHTGDLGCLDQHGRLRIQGRAKALIRTGGKSVQPAEVEEVLCGHPAVLEAAVVGVEDLEWGEIVAAAIVARPGVPMSADDIHAYCRENLSSHKRPKYVLFMDALPRSHYGKVLTRKIREAIAASRTSLPH
ncbi:class I adenylate-forming enzyme family protein [Pigmentiphaga sp.]|jgi:Acyl-CoA synthetases (AMP-forming)/AMP-acid ligases II|uniref:class I adenylate-forming enzyme family protein n=1 Tax=Pigmentiphaga sp. TaxID=1977564 RepID=UPI0025CF48C4|nr:class I adenylate-forming enzyme family protein [Pigmentiphaga sp.]MBX6318364.1 acyl--CoA ligase [Pigmentiphaga sp.]